ncbi:hypothetical protein ACFVTY_06755 [Streptomyces sp. NPDC058067]|uniref:hypothetical protein n=1 Tax=Streptomyces sp. NPDC058067 TaxID=3346324 RepID=UPI0036EAD953
MVRHHKPNGAVAGDTYDSHARGLPLRPDPDELDRRTRDDERAVGIRVKKEKGPEDLYEEVRDEIDRQVDRGQMPTAAPPSRRRQS